MLGPRLEYGDVVVLAGLMCSDVFIAAAYLTQLSLYNKSFKPPSSTQRRPHLFYLRFAILMFLGSLSCFAVGSMNAVNAWASKPNPQPRQVELPELHTHAAGMEAPVGK